MIILISKAPPPTFSLNPVRERQRHIWNENGLKAADATTTVPTVLYPLQGALANLA